MFSFMSMFIYVISHIYDLTHSSFSIMANNWHWNCNGSVIMSLTHTHTHTLQNIKISDSETQRYHVMVSFSKCFHINIAFPQRRRVPRSCIHTDLQNVRLSMWISSLGWFPSAIMSNKTYSLQQSQRNMKSVLQLCTPYMHLQHTDYK